MGTYQVGIAGPIPLEDGRVVTAEQGTFELDVTTPHDQELVDRGVLIAVAAPTKSKPSSASADAKTGDSTKEGE